MIVVTGALGFIGSCMVRKLNDEGFIKDLMVVDDFYKDYKEPNLKNKFIREWIHMDIFLETARQMPSRIDFIFHLGARTDTSEQDKTIFDKLNLNYSKELWEFCTECQIPLIYASSAATYGAGEHGFKDDHKIVSKLKPLNHYGDSKNEFDRWVLKQKKTPPFWAGVKFFNVYGPNEYQKARMASVIFHTFEQIKATGEMKLFRSHKKGYKDGEQMRDFVYVKDVVDVLYFLFKQQKSSGLYNIGTGKARSFLDLATLTFKAMGRQPKITYIDIPEDIRENYQYFTEADISKLRKTGYNKPFHSLEEGIEDYVKNYLIGKKVW